MPLNRSADHHNGDGDGCQAAAKHVEDSTTFLAAARRYADLIAPVVAAPTSFEPEVETAGAVQVERGTVLATAIDDPATDPTPQVERLLQLADPATLDDLLVVDRAGHARPAYRGLLVFACLQAFRLVYETLPRAQFGRWEEGLRPWCDDLESRLGMISWPAGDGAIQAAHGATATEAAWMALALHVAGKVYIRDAWTDLASDTFGRIVRSQANGGASPGPFLRTGGSDNPETHWYHELVLLHAAGTYAAQAEDRTVAAAVARNVLFHLSETQPDHATNQPWAVFPFVWVAPARSLADAALHAALVQQPDARNGLSLMLLADALYCLRLFLK
jgi:hypothetical protein